MKITKLVHSCFILEKDGKRILVDPGVYSWQSGVVEEDLMSDLDSVVVTHEHPDHLSEDFVDLVKTKSPGAKWYGPSQVVSQLADWGINGSSSSDDDSIVFIESSHADLDPWFPEQPEHTSFVLFNEVLVGGDCHTLSDSHGARIFAGAINGGPWGAVVGFARMIEAMDNRPEVVIPAHDWHWNDEARKGIYNRLGEVMEAQGVKFVPMENGLSVDI